jgi:hypothetical protein
MAVVKRPPLIVPPDYNLRPPRPGEARSEGGAASKAARDTLIGPSSNSSPGVTGAPAASSAAAADQARATLIGRGDDPEISEESSPVLTENGQATAPGAAPSAGQSALLSRTNRVERDLDALNETRAENRVDGALLRRLLTWQPAEAADASDIVQIIKREQTPVVAGAASE